LEGEGKEEDLVFGVFRHILTRVPSLTNCLVAVTRIYKGTVNEVGEDGHLER